MLDGTGSSDADGDALDYSWTGPFGTVMGATPMVTLPMGAHEITLTVDDNSGAQDTDTVTITVADNTGPSVAASASPSILWPPSHRMVPVVITASSVDNCGNAQCRIVSVTSSEPGNGAGDGRTSPDWAITGSLTLELRAERSGGGGGRFYAVTVECTDAIGNAAQAVVSVTVPHSQ
jgi:hypothetical protein